MAKVFVSHATTDTKLVDSLKDLFEKSYGAGNVSFLYSSSKLSGSGIPSGDDWYNWILKEVRACDIALIVLTPNSINKPWLLWEAGAVKGVTLATEEDTKVLPIIFGLGKNEVPDVLAKTQNVQGDDPDEVKKMLIEIFETWQGAFSQNALVNFLQVDKIIVDYLNSVKEILPDLPVPISNSMIDEWCLRINDFVSQGRSNEVEVLERWIWMSFGLSQGKEEYPIDMKLHRIIGDAYLSGKIYDKAILHFKLANKIVPRDIFILRKLGQSLIECKRFSEAEKILARIDALDPNAFVENAECAGLKGRFFRDRYNETQSETDLKQSRNAYYAASQKNSQSYYLADNAGQLSLLLGDDETARSSFSAASKIIGRLPNQNVWSLATGIASELFLGNKGLLQNIV